MKRPLLLTLLMALLFAAAGYLLVTWVYTAVGSGPWRFTQRDITRETWFLYTLPMLLTAEGILLGPALALLRHKWWARHAVAGLCLLLIVLSAVIGTIWTYPAQRLGRLLLGYALMLAPCFWYLYGKKGVKSYFAALRQGANAV